MAEVLLNGCCDQTHKIVDLANKMPLKCHDRKYQVHCFLTMGKNKPRCNQQHHVLIPFDEMASVDIGLVEKPFQHTCL